MTDKRSDGMGATPRLDLGDLAAALSLDDLLMGLVCVPDLKREVAELRRKVEALEGRAYRCACGSTELVNVKTRKTAGEVKRWKRCRACGALVRTREVIAG